MPEIVGVFVMATHRRRGVGRELFVRAIERCRARGLVPLKATLITRMMRVLVKKLPADALRDVQIVDHSHMSPW
jgi:GNAT superfamily N-acetyltransferase